MSANPQLNFLREKIQEIGSAIFFNLSDAVLKFPTSIVSTLKVDDYGYIWFFMKKPKQNIKEFETEFPVRLDFFKKGKEYFLQVMGKASIIMDPEELNLFMDAEEVTDCLNGDVVLIKVKMLKAEFFETQQRQKAGWWQVALSSMTSWFRPGVNTNTYFPAS
jgi:general stress protein 26